MACAGSGKGASGAKSTKAGASSSEGTSKAASKSRGGGKGSLKGKGKGAGGGGSRKGAAPGSPGMRTYFDDLGREREVRSKFSAYRICFVHYRVTRHFQVNSKSISASRSVDAPSRT